MIDIKPNLRDAVAFAFSLPTDQAHLCAIHPAGNRPVVGRSFPKTEGGQAAALRWLIEADREKQSRRIWSLVPLSVVWTNLHGGFLALIAVLGLCAVGTALEAFAAREAWGGLWWRNAGRYLGLAAACAAVSLINPYGYQLHVHM